MPVCLMRNLLRQFEDCRRLDSTHKQCSCAGFLTVRAERALHWWLPPHHSSQSEGANALALLTPHHSLVQDLGKNSV